MANRRMLPRAREQEIAELAEFVADDYCPSGTVDPEAILRELGITVSFGAYGDAFDGMLECENRRFHVFCNTERDSPRGSGRARFTLGHELGHYFIDEHRTALLGGVDPHHSKCEYESSERIEQEADAFASNLLLPRGRFLSEGRALRPGLSGILPLAGKFKTSVSATAIRYVREELVPCTVIRWNADGFAWKWFSPATWEAGYRRTIESRENLPPDSATELAFAGKPLPSDGFHHRGSTAALWFPFVTGASSKNVIIHEEAVTLGQFGVLTFLYPEGGSYAQQW